MTQTINVTREQFDQLVSGLRILADLPIRNDVAKGDDWPIFEYNGTIVRVGHVQDARRALALLSDNQNSEV